MLLDRWLPEFDVSKRHAIRIRASRERVFVLLIEEHEPGSVLLSTETRVLCLGDAARRKFLLYCRVVEPFSGVIRQSLLRGVRRASQAGSGLHLTLSS
ncbi:MAG TPA: hypothetical protein VNC59_01985 [Thermoanaerobaculia bacterium]|nr:hypothetical protein [Thermoanaerobaculia bacterium]